MITTDEREQIVQDVLNEMKSSSQDVNELESVASLDGVNSLPAMKGEKVVTVPINLLSKPADTAANNATAAAAAAAAAAENARQAVITTEQVTDAAILAGQQATEAAATAIAAAERAEDVTNNIIGSLVGDMTAIPDEESDTVKLSIIGKMGDELATVDIPGGMGGGGNTLNVTEEVPLASGYYTLSSAIVAVEEKQREKGRCITYEAAQGVWETKQFIGTDISSWEQAASWEDFGGAGTVKSITVNGNIQNPDDTGNVSITFSETEVDESLDSSSTNPVQNAAVTTKLNEVDANTVFGASAELSEDESTVRLALTNKSGAEIVAVDLPAGSGGSGGETQTTKIVLNASVDNNTIKEGGSAMLTYTYDHQNVGGDEAGSSTGQKATIEITMKRGSSTVYASTLQDVSKGSYQLDLTKYLFVGTTDVYVKATVTDPATGKVQAKQSYVSVKAVTLSLSSSYNLATNVANGGYGMSDTVSVPFTVAGSGTKIVTLYFDGVQVDARTVTKSGTSNGSFSVPLSGKSIGRHNIQMVAEMEASAELTLRSESIYIDILKRGSDTPYIGAMITDANGVVYDKNSYLTPHISAKQYEQLSIQYIMYDAAVTPARMTITKDGVDIQTVSVPRAIQYYNNRFTETGEVNMRFSAGATQYPFVIDVLDSGIELSETTYGLVMKLSAAGRSNEESNPAVWESGNVSTVFENVDFKTSGWTGSSLRLLNGASAYINYLPFASDAATNGSTLEFEFKVSNVTDSSLNVISCINNNKGFEITGNKASMYTGSTKQVTDEEGNTTTQPVGVGRQYGQDKWIKAAFVIGRRADGRKMELYVDGTRSAADIYSEGDNFMQEVATGIRIESVGADVEVRNIRAYNRALSDNEEVDNHIVDQQTIEAMLALFEENDVLNDSGDSIDFEKLRKKGKAIMLVVRKDGLDPVNAENNKKADFLADVHIWMPDGRYIYLKNIYIRIQGTSSTKYARKNYRIYCAKGESPELYIDGVKQDNLKLALRIGQAAVKVLCAKADFSDSSMVQNTGGAQIFNRMMRNLGFLTPPQELDSEIRVAVDGFPIDVFAAETIEEIPTYYGQYNLNHDKSDWYDIIGMKGVEGLDAPCPIAFEFLNNTEPIGLFQGAPDLDAQAAASFDNALEFNYPKDVTWDTATEAQKNAYKRLWGWVRDCVPAGADVNNIDTFTSAKFKSEVGDYFDTNFLFTWYLFTDYNTMVDQRVKNMIATTWDGLKWFLIYYDGDTQLGDRNDSFLAYLYNITRDTWDAEKSKYAFEGHDSWLWCLVLANMQDELKAMATKMRTVLTEDMVHNVFDNEQQANWCARTYNKSGEFKYIIPMTEGVIVGGENVKYPHIYALKGDKQSFRHWFIKNRYALLDAKYGTGNYLSDNIDMYMSRKATDVANTIDVTSNELYYFGYGTNNAPHLQASQEADKGDVVTLRFTNAFTVNDPLRLYGASRMAELDMRGSANNITGDINLNKCSVLRKLDISTTGAGSNGWCMVLDQCRQLVEINLNGQTNARTGTLSSTELNFSNHTKLTRLDAGGVNVDGIVFAEGAPLVHVRMSGNIKTLRLEYLPILTNAGLVVDGYSNVETFRFSSCPNLDVWSILERCVNVKRIRVTDVNLEGDGALLDKYLATGGVDAAGNATETCAFVGNYQLTKFVSDAKYNAYVAHYPELNIRQPQHTMIEFDDSVSDDANITNLDNNTGYKYGNTYTMSGHLSKIFAQRFRCLAKQAVKGTMTIFPLHDANSNYYADAEVVGGATPAKLDSTEGDVMMYEPHFWFKGVNDYLNNKKYSCYSSNASMPDKPEATVISYDDIVAAKGVKLNYKILSGKPDLQASYTADSNYSTCQVPVNGYKKVRFPTVPGTGLICSLFTDDAGTILDSVMVNTLVGKFEPGMYLIADVPVGATYINFTIQKTAEFDCVVLSNSNRIEDMEPDWCEHEECLVGVFETTIINTKFRSCISGGASTGSMTWTDFNYYSGVRGMQQIDYEMHRDIANLFFARYGRRDSQAQCGAGEQSSARKTGGTAGRGMTDTIGFDEAKSINDALTPVLVDDANPRYSWYIETDEYGGRTVKQLVNSCCLGYEDIYGDKYEMMDGVMVNKGLIDGKWSITMPDGTERKVKGSITSGMWITGVVHGKHCDIIPAGSISGSFSTNYGDIFYYTAGLSRVVYRSCHYAYAYGGVSMAYANHDVSNSSASVGSRLAFRGTIVRAASVSDFKSLQEIL